MDRRAFLALSCATALAPLSLSAAPLDYSPGLVTKHLEAGDTVFLDFKASWCTTCAAQERVLNALKAENPAYEQAITFINVDWDSYGNSELAKSLNIPRRSTLVVLKGNAELGRIVADTSRSSIQALMDTALAAATA
ncbi:thioredoxin family protein [Tropicimonas sp. IMCC6043]|uniref:thioredoxin family protein n=1 Tax=Tropicimonas sp. IMCC6043 TaxID=2510645 RepID=UPI00101D90F6|nr:thioredoxin family protein [Tropicimonas sp. IMCC6043]RYH09944.1 thioredoxin [Tropicimonas sp. IMCC6043]